MACCDIHSSRHLNFLCILAVKKIDLKIMVYFRTNRKLTNQVTTKKLNLCLAMLNKICQLATYQLWNFPQEELSEFEHPSETYAWNEHKLKNMYIMLNWATSFFKPVKIAPSSLRAAFMSRTSKPELTFSLSIKMVLNRRTIRYSEFVCKKYVNILIFSHTTKVEVNTFKISIVFTYLQKYKLFLWKK